MKIPLVQGKMKNIHHFIYSMLLICLFFLLSACASTATQIAPQQTVTIDKGFQAQTSPVPAVPTYRCGAWSSNNAPGAFSTIIIYAKLTKDVMGVGGATAQGVVHFQGNDQPLNKQAVSDAGGYVSFTLPLQGRQPRGVPATVDVSFNVSGTQVACTPAFFTPQ
ncbi:MAG TPA: hypothetical protein VKY19_13635 [Ktedonosporobacter sp.]|jgi:hypothetical protein|nr:hypothetical protein [Ktedonosporobacter sp.]